MAITKTMLAKCQNELKRAFCALPEDVQKAMKATDAKYIKVLRPDGVWSVVSFGDLPLHDGVIYRLSPDTPCEPEYDERTIEPDTDGLYRLAKPGPYSDYTISMVACVRGFSGILYRSADGTETWRTTIDCAFGTPVKVRFTK